MEAAKHVLMGLFMAALGVTGLAGVLHLDRMVQFASLVSLAVVSSVGAMVFFYSAFRR